MFLPKWNKGKIDLPEGQIDIDNCYLCNIVQLWDLPPTYSPYEDGIIRFVIDRDYGEISVFIDPRDESLVELHLEFLENIDFNVLLKFYWHGLPVKYSFVEFQNEIYAVFSRNFKVRLSSADQKVARLIFMNTDYVESRNSDFAMQIKRIEKSEPTSQ